MIDHIETMSHSSKAFSCYSEYNHTKNDLNFSKQVILTCKDLKDRIQRLAHKIRNIDQENVSDVDRMKKINDCNSEI